jgi:hypothetical protein
MKDWELSKIIMYKSIFRMKDREVSKIITYKSIFKDMFLVRMVWVELKKQLSVESSAELCFSCFEPLD